MLGKHRGPGGHGSPNTTYIAVIIVVVVIIAGVALVFFGGSGSTGGESGPAAASTTTAPAGATTPQNTVAKGTTLDPAAITVPTTVAIANTGTYIRVSYLGSYKGTYDADGQVYNITSSGDRLFTIKNSSQTVTVNVKKTDRSTKQTLTAEIWKDGKLLGTKNTSALYGEIAVTAAV